MQIKRTHNLLLIFVLRTHKIRHLKRTLYLHLSGTHKILADWGNPEFICTAGLFHSIYGTQIFQHATISISRRPWLQWFLGSQAEYLAYLFCVINRQEEFKKNRGSNEISVVDTVTGETIILDTDTFNALQEMEVANLLEQGCKKEKIANFLNVELSTKAKALLLKAVQQSTDYIVYDRLT